MRTFNSADDFVKYLDDINQDKGNSIGCSPVILPENIKYTGRGTEEVFEKGYVICLFGKQHLRYCFDCSENGKRLKDAGGKIKETEKISIRDILERKQPAKASA